MPSSQRRARERANTRDRIIEAALHVLENEGSAALTIRRIATDVEYSAPVVYQHFANKEALVLELVAYGHGLLLAELQQVLGESDIDQRMLRVAAEYVRFAGAHPHLYEIMNGTAVAADDRRRAAEPAIDVFKAQLTTWTQAHDVALADLDEACEIIWGTVHGLASLGHLGTIGNQRAQRLAEQAVHAILLGWQTSASRNG